MNTYAYVGNSPLSETDPTGLNPFAAARGGYAVGQVLNAALNYTLVATTGLTLGGILYEALNKSNNTLGAANGARRAANPVAGDVPTGDVDFPANDPCKPDRNDCSRMQTQLYAERGEILRLLAKYPGLKLQLRIQAFNDKVTAHNVFCPRHQVKPI